MQFRFNVWGWSIVSQLVVLMWSFLHQACLVSCSWAISPPSTCCHMGKGHDFIRLIGFNPGPCARCTERLAAPSCRWRWYHLLLMEKADTCRENMLAYHKHTRRTGNIYHMQQKPMCVWVTGYIFVCQYASRRPKGVCNYLVLLKW